MPENRPEPSSISEYIIPRRADWLVPFFYLQLIAVAEVLTALREPRSGLVIHGFTLVALLVHGGIERRMPTRRFIFALTLAPLIRLLSLSLPLGDQPLLIWYMWVGALVFLATFFSGYVLEFNLDRIGLNAKKLPLQIVFGLTGIVTGVIEYLILFPDPLIPELTLAELIWPAFILLIFTGVLEEIVFRGLIQEAALVKMGRFGLTYVALLFAVLHVGYNSFSDIIFVFAVGFLFGYFVMKTGSLLGVSLAHGFNNIVLFLVMPFIFGASEPAVDAPQDIFAPLAVTVTPTSLPALATPLFPSDFEETASPTVIVTSGPGQISPTETDVPIAAASPTSTIGFEILPTTQPTSTNCSTPPGWVPYTVASGDSLFSLSRAFGVTVLDLQNGNCMGSSTLLVAGKSIYVPNVPTITPVPSSTWTASALPPTATNTSAPTDTPTITPTATDTPIPTNTFTPTNTSTPTQTPTP
ncbi:type II CAAX prenyl endopeptidase Rce1 family protein [Chloroflexota bacterium]